MYRFLAFFSILFVLFSACKKSTEYGYVRLVFEHHWGDSIAKIDGITPYTNAAGNVVTLESLEYFISDLTLYGNTQTTLANPRIRYVCDDNAYLETLITEQIPVGNYSNIGFVFGLHPNDNISNSQVNSPEKDMFWPENMGGGYHFLKLNGKWKNQIEIENQGFELHLGSLKKVWNDTISVKDTLFKPGTDSIIRIVDTIQVKPITQWFYNHFPVSISKTIKIEKDKITTIKIIMDLKQWMESPYTWDFNKMSTAIMSREYAMDSLKANGVGVFR